MLVLSILCITDWLDIFDTGDEAEKVSIYSDAAVRLALRIPSPMIFRIELVSEAIVQPSGA